LKTSFYIARRYLLSKKSHNAINIISAVAACGLIVATMATVCTLSVFNGFQRFGTDMFSAFDPEIKITAQSGKTFDLNTLPMQQIRELPAVALITETLEDNILLRYGDRQTPAVMKGVADNFRELVPIERALFNDTLRLYNETSPLATLGIGVANTLGVNANYLSPLELYVPKRTSQINLANPTTWANSETACINDVFMINEQIYDDAYLIVPISLARQLLEYTDTQVSALEIKLQPGSNTKSVKTHLRQLLGADYEVKDRIEQQAEAFRMINVEKWVSFLMLSFILLIASFNVIGSLSILIVDKQADVATLRSLGADNRLISGIFLAEGWLISAVGAISGVALGVLLCLGQQHFGWIKLGSGMFAVEAYPVALSVSDLAITLAVALAIGFLLVMYPVRYLFNKTVR